MRHLLLGFLCATVFCAYAVNGRPAVRAAAWGRVPQPGRDHDTDARVEHFRLEIAEDGAGLADGAEGAWSARGAGGAGTARKVGVVAWRRDRFANGMQLECEITFFAGPSEGSEHRVLHVEQLGPSGPRLVWRELGVGSGRSVLAEWTDDGHGLRTVEWSGAETLRETIDTNAGAVMPLYLVELVRSGQATSGSQLRFDPLSRALEVVLIHTSYEPEGTPSDPSAALAPDVPALRTVELARLDGTLAMRCRFRGAELVAFQWQAGPLSASRIDAQEYALLLGREPVISTDGPATRDP